MTARQRTTPHSINTPELLLGVHWIPLVVITFICGWVMLQFSFKFGAGIFLAIVVSAQIATRIDEQLIPILLVSLWFPKMLDAIERESFELVVTEE